MTQPGNFPLTAPDLVCLPDMSPLAVETTSEEQNLTQDLLHAIVQLPNSNLDAPGRGVGIMRYLNGTNLASARVAIEEDFVKDPRVIQAVATITQNPPSLTGFPFTIGVQVTTTAGVLGLSFGWSQTGIQLLPTS
jgi:hypothetical protein